MAARFFETTFRLTALFTGAAAFNHMADSVKNIDKQIKTADKSSKAASMSFSKLAAAAVGVAAGIISIQKVAQYLNTAKQNAEASQKAFDKLGVSLRRIPQMQKMELLKPGTIEDQQKKLNALALSMEKAGGIAQNTLAAGFAAASMSFSPEKINQASAGIQDLIVKIGGIAATPDQVADAFGKINRAIRDGTTKGLVQAGILTKAQDKAFLAMNKGGVNVAKNTKWFHDIIRKETNLTAIQMDTMAGKLQQNQQAWDRVSTSIGTIQVAMETKLAPVFEKIARALEPVVEKLADKLIKWFDDMGPHL